ncbi:hypothetical protein [Azospirillum sp. TSH58]|uniref:hypothetical protein n=1 Tax=Azospirillum sp. TSH58 TaxID=664962 RepID=UPI001FFF332C|nr:hypothetical protein [Azospirillum sp. TSH58]
MDVRMDPQEFVQDGADEFEIGVVGGAAAGIADAHDAAGRSPPASGPRRFRRGQQLLRQAVRQQPDTLHPLVGQHARQRRRAACRAVAGPQQGGEALRLVLRVPRLGLSGADELLGVGLGKGHVVEVGQAHDVLRARFADQRAQPPGKRRPVENDDVVGAEGDFLAAGFQEGFQGKPPDGHSRATQGSLG